MLDSVLADRLEHPVAVAVARDQALVNERPERLDVGRADVLDRIQRRAAREDREACEDVALVRVEQSRGPGDRGTEGLLPWVGVPAALQQVEAVAQPVEDLRGCQDGAPSRCELEREREVVEALAQLQDGRARLEGRVEGSYAGGEEVETFRSRQLRDRIHVFAREPEPLTARDHELWAVEVS